ncbi:MAG: glycosyltransferase family 2 protein [Candidatus Omnitrophota bacterium]
MTLSIIIVNHHGAAYLKDCLRSIYSQAPALDFETLVIDNHSQDQSRLMLKRDFPQVKTIFNQNNLGFAKAVNQGLRVAQGEYLLLLNNDTTVLPQSLEQLADFMDSTPQALAAGGKVLNPDGSLQYSCRRFPGIWTSLFNRRAIFTRLFGKNRFSTGYLMSDWDHNEARVIDWVSACYLIMRRQAIEKVGLFDERFFMYCEDVDWCLRAKKLGFKIYYCPQAPVIHATQGYGKNLLLKIFSHHQSMFYYYRKHLSRGLIIDGLVLSAVVVRAVFVLLLEMLRQVGYKERISCQQ